MGLATSGVLEVGIEFGDWGSSEGFLMTEIGFGVLGWVFISLGLCLIIDGRSGGKVEVQDRFSGRFFPLTLFYFWVFIFRIVVDPEWGCFLDQIIMFLVKYQL